MLFKGLGLATTLVTFIILPSQAASGTTVIRSIGHKNLKAQPDVVRQTPQSDRIVRAIGDGRYEARTAVPNKAVYASQSSAPKLSRHFESPMTLSKADATVATIVGTSTPEFRHPGFPELASWTLMITGVAMIGGAFRLLRRDLLFLKDV